MTGRVAKGCRNMNISADRLTISEVTVGKYVVISSFTVTRDWTMRELARAVSTMMEVLSPLSSL